MVLSWLLNSLSKDIAESVIYSQTASELWNELEETYGQADGTKLFQLQRELNNITQGSYDVAGYFNKLKKIWDQMKELNTYMTCSCECKYGAKEHNHKVNEDQKLIQFLMGLSKAYNGARGNILMMKPLPTAAQAYSIVLHEESQRRVHSSNQLPIDASAFLMQGQKWTSQKKVFESKGGNQIVQVDGKKSDLFCRYCKKSGHLKEDCYKLVGYPQHFKFTNGRQKKGNPTNQYANVVNSEELLTSGNAGNNLNTLISNQTFTKEQCEKLVLLFQSMQGGCPSASIFEPSASADLAGPFIEEGSSFW
ncbi:PREDICTED: uncharacterized protein LOC109241929 [Nicotiana attenuata]|uniref:uncharacterized protein LOC109241929 n=1 Tax=Nicotiana attenuata TaxID=49451 RepID=UPI0009050845|nr:PREDICTED: uncharacterized protein LOC109241929 [Nicotiana attenuata]